MHHNCFLHNMRKLVIILFFFGSMIAKGIALPLVDTIDLSKTPQARELALLSLNPRAIPFVKDYLEVHQRRLTNMKSTALPYFMMIEKILKEQGLPPELKYLAVIESDLKSNAVSWVGAVGPWQFMPETGRLMGLKVNAVQDERTDLFKSTYAAAKYLKKLYAELNDWLLVIAAYNGGPLRVTSAIRKSSSKDFWDLQYHLPAESRTHVKKFIATHFIMEGKGGVTTMGAEDHEKLELLSPNAELLKGTTTHVISGKYLSTEIARYTGIDHTLFKKLNPQFDIKVAEENYTMRLPESSMKIFHEKKLAILEASIFTRIQQPVSTATAYPKEIALPPAKKKKS